MDPRDLPTSVFRWRPSVDGRRIHRHAAAAVVVVLADGKDNHRRMAGNLDVALEAVVS